MSTKIVLGWMTQKLWNEKCAHIEGFLIILKAE
jgi:hypothetical protein